MYCVALTGTIASGKSTAARFFAELGIDVIHADNMTKALTAKDEPAFLAIIAHFGNNVLSASGELNRAYLRHLIFNNQNERKWLEGLLHPLIRQKIHKDASAAQSPYCIIEIPLLFKRADYPYINRVLYVHADAERQIQRIQKRDECTREEAAKILNNQASHQQYLDIADDVINNTGNIQALKNKILQLHSKYQTFAQNN